MHCCALLLCFTFILLPAVVLPQKSPRGAVILTMAGKGAPKYLDWCCISIEASKELFDMLLFHEDNSIIESLPCASNVKKINVKEGGLARLISRALTKPFAETDSSIESKEKKLISQMSTVLENIPYFLAQFKIGSGAIFEEYLQEYTHWTYSDPDIIWGNLDEWLSPRELEEFDVISFGKLNDAARLFLRGQFSLHKNEPRLNWRWISLENMHVDKIMSLMDTVVASLHRGVPRSIIKQILFESAEGAYSQHIFSMPDVSVLIAGRMFSDKTLHPVMWMRKTVTRCICDHVKTCINHAVEERVVENNNQYCIYLEAATESRLQLPPLNLQQSEEVGSFDCGMNWLKTPYRKCLSPAHHQRIINEAILSEGKWYANNEILSPRLRIQSGAMFHFRVWEDDLSEHVVSFPAREGTTCFIVYLALLESKMYIHECDEDLVSESGDFIPDKKSSKKLVLGMLKSNRKKTKDEITAAKNAVKHNGV